MGDKAVTCEGQRVLFVKLFERGHESLRWTGVALGHMRAALGGEVREISHFT